MLNPPSSRLSGVSRLIPALLMFAAGMGAQSILATRFRPSPASDDATVAALQALERKVAAQQATTSFGQQQCLAAVNQLRSSLAADTTGRASSSVQLLPTKPVDPAAEQRSVEAVSRGHALLTSAVAKGVWDPEYQRQWHRIMGATGKAGHAELFQALISHFDNGTLRPTARESADPAVEHPQ
jgi:hypothetical protein